MFKRFCAFCFAFAALLLPCRIAQGAYTPSAEYAVVMDARTHRILFEKNAHMPHPMASTTKIMTALLACESNRLQETVVVTAAMLAGTEGSSLYLAEGDSISLMDLVKGALLASGNDAAHAIGVFLSGSVETFLEAMNQKAVALGMQNTVFETPSGLDKGAHHSTAYDMALLSAYAMQNPVFREICAMKSAQIMINGKAQMLYNHNKLLQRSAHFSGIKTGYTQKAGRCLVSAYEYYSSRIICVTFNAPEDWKDHAYYIKEAKKQYQLLQQEAALRVALVGSQANEVACHYGYQVAVLETPAVKEYYFPFLYAPVSAGAEVGYAEISCADEVLLRVPIQADETYERITIQEDYGEQK